MLTSSMRVFAAWTSYIFYEMATNCKPWKLLMFCSGAAVLVIIIFDLVANCLSLLNLNIGVFFSFIFYYLTSLKINPLNNNYRALY